MTKKKVRLKLTYSEDFIIKLTFTFTIPSLQNKLKTLVLKKEKNPEIVEVIPQYLGCFHTKNIICRNPIQIQKYIWGQI
jgi:hypothetical protein